MTIFMEKGMTRFILVFGLLLLPAVAVAKQDVSIAITAEKEVITIEKGKEVKTRVQAKEAMPGDVIFFTIHFENKDKDAVTNVDVVDPIPEGMTYINGSAFGAGTEISFSIDQGKSFKQASVLTYEVNGQKRMASPEAYSHIRWLVKKLDAGKSGIAGFKAKVK